MIKKIFVPHKDNNHKPYFLRNRITKHILGLVLVIEVFALLIISPVFSDLFSKKFDYIAAVLPGVLVSKTNESREDVGQNELTSNQLLVLAAQMKANDMAEKSYFAHTSPDGKTPWYWLGLSGYRYKNAGENLAVNFVDSDDVHDAWMNSPTHKANILRDGFEEIGIATAEGYYKGKKAIFVAQFFGDPADSIPVNNVAINNTNDSSPIEQENVLETQGAQEEVLGLEVESNNSENKEEEKIPVSQVTVAQELSKESNTNNVIEVAADETFIFNNPDSQGFETELVLGSDSLESGISNDKNIDQADLKISLWEKMLASPKTTLFYLMISILIVTVISLILKIFVHVKIQYPKLIINGLLIVVLIIGCIYLNHYLVNIYAEII